MPDDAGADALKQALQQIVDLPCPLSREGDLLSEAQRIASRAIGDANEARKRP